MCVKEDVLIPVGGGLFPCARTVCCSRRCCRPSDGCLLSLHGSTFGFGGKFHTNDTQAELGALQRAMEGLQQRLEEADRDKRQASELHSSNTSKVCFRPLLPSGAAYSLLLRQ